MLGGFIDCDNQKDEGSGDGKGCSRWMMWAAVSSFFYFCSNSLFIVSTFLTHPLRENHSTSTQTIKAEAETNTFPTTTIMLVHLLRL